MANVWSRPSDRAAAGQRRCTGQFPTFRACRPSAAPRRARGLLQRCVPTAPFHVSANVTHPSVPLAGRVACRAFLAFAVVSPCALRFCMFHSFVAVRSFPAHRALRGHEMNCGSPAAATFSYWAVRLLLWARQPSPLSYPLIDSHLVASPQPLPWASSASFTPAEDFFSLLLRWPMAPTDILQGEW